MTQTTERTSVAGLSDGQLRVQIKHEQVDAFGELYDRYCDRAYRLARVVCRDRGRAEEAVQNAFLSVWRSRATYLEDRGSVAAWLLTIVRHRAIDIARYNTNDTAWCDPEDALRFRAHPRRRCRTRRNTSRSPTHTRSTPPPPRSSKSRDRTRVLRRPLAHRDRYSPRPFRWDREKPNTARPSKAPHRTRTTRRLTRRPSDDWDYVRLQPPGGPCYGEHEVVAGGSFGASLCPWGRRCAQSTPEHGAYAPFASRRTLREARREP